MHPIEQAAGSERWNDTRREVSNLRCLWRPGPLHRDHRLGQRRDRQASSAGNHHHDPFGDFGKLFSLGQSRFRVRTLLLFLVVFLVHAVSFRHRYLVWVRVSPGRSVNKCSRLVVYPSQRALSADLPPPRPAERGSETPTNRTNLPALWFDGLDTSSGLFSRFPAGMPATALLPTPGQNQPPPSSTGPTRPVGGEWEPKMVIFL